MTAAIARRAVRALGAAPDWTGEQFRNAVLSASESTLAELRACDQTYYATGEAIADQLFEFIKLNHTKIEIGAASTQQ
jgi:hypothetical protein